MFELSNIVNGTLFMGDGTKIDVSEASLTYEPNKVYENEAWKGRKIGMSFVFDKEDYKKKHKDAIDALNILEDFFEEYDEIYGTPEKYSNVNNMIDEIEWYLYDIRPRKVFSQEVE